MNGKIVDFFATTVGNIYFIEFSAPDFIPNFNLKIKYLEYYFKIKSLSRGDHEFYNSSGKLYKNKVWSCALETIDKSKDVTIPIGADIQIIP